MLERLDKNLDQKIYLLDKKLENDKKKVRKNASIQQLYD